MNFLVNRVERRAGMDLNGDRYIGGEGFLNKLERRAHIDFNGDNVIGRRPNAMHGRGYGGYRPMGYGGHHHRTHHRY